MSKDITTEQPTEQPDATLISLEKAIAYGSSGSSHEAQIHAALAYWQSCLASGSYVWPYNASHANAAIYVLNRELARIGGNGQ